MEGSLSSCVTVRRQHYILIKVSLRHPFSGGERQITASNVADSSKEVVPSTERRPGIRAQRTIRIVRGSAILLSIYKYI